MAELISRLSQIMLPHYREAPAGKIHQLTAGVVAGLPKRSHLARHPTRLMEPVNLIFIGSQADIVRAFKAAGWRQADLLTAETVAKTTLAALFNAPYPAAPVPPLFIRGQAQRLAFQKPTRQHSLRWRHIVRFWPGGFQLPNGKPVWVATGTFASGLHLVAPPVLLAPAIDMHIDRARAFVRADLLGAGVRDLGQFKLHHSTTSDGSDGKPTPTAHRDLYVTDGQAVALDF